MVNCFLDESDQSQSQGDNVPNQKKRKLHKDDDDYPNKKFKLNEESFEVIDEDDNDIANDIANDNDIPFVTISEDESENNNVESHSSDDGTFSIEEIKQYLQEFLNGYQNNSIHEVYTFQRKINTFSKAITESLATNDAELFQMVDQNFSKVWKYMCVPLNIDINDNNNNFVKIVKKYGQHLLTKHFRNKEEDQFERDIITQILKKKEPKLN